MIYWPCMLYVTQGYSIHLRSDKVTQTRIGMGKVDRCILYSPEKVVATIIKKALEKNCQEFICS